MLLKMAHFLFFFQIMPISKPKEHIFANSESGLFSKVVERWKKASRENGTKTELMIFSLLFENSPGECIISEEKFNF